jgi:citrate lyase beta subunit
MPKAIHAAAQGGAEVFLRIDARRAAAQLAATLFSGVTGVLLTNVAAAETIGVIARSLDELEAQRGFIRDELEIAVEVDNAAAVWHSLEIARKSARFSFFLLNEHGLCAHLGMQSVPELDFDPLEYIRSQLITVATAAGGMALGMSYPLGLTAQDADEAIVRRAVTRARDSGFKGALCPHDRWVRICNEGFRPSADESAYYLKVIEVFAEGIKRGMASVPLDGKMLDVPVDLRAKLYLNWANRANARDEQKALARSLRRSSHE